MPVVGCSKWSWPIHQWWATELVGLDDVAVSDSRSERPLVELPCTAN